MSITTLKAYIKKHGKAKTAVALGLTETNAINNYLSRKHIPQKMKEKVRSLKGKMVKIVETERSQ